MKSLLTLTLLFSVVVSHAEPSQTNSTAPSAATLTFTAISGKLTAPFVATNGILLQPDVTDVVSGGKAVYSFTITNAGNYIIRAQVNAPDDISNSVYVNVDSQPEDPAMIWDIEITNGFEKRTVSWRGTGADGSAEFNPKRFNLNAGAHQLIIVGREPAQLKSISILRAK